MIRQLQPGLPLLGAQLSETMQSTQTEVRVKGKGNPGRAEQEQRSVYTQPFLTSWARRKGGASLTPQVQAQGGASLTPQVQAQRAASPLTSCPGAQA